MTVPLIFLPRLHRELAFMAEFSAIDAPTLPFGVLTLSPGLPASVVGADVYTPDYPWSTAESAACVADFERLAHEGAHGLPVQAMAVNEIATEELSPAEQRALANWKQDMGNLDSAAAPFTTGLAAAGSVAPASGGTLPREEAKKEAQRVLLLAWLREKQALELQELEKRVGQNSRLLAGWLGDGVISDKLSFINPPVGVAVPLSQDLALPPWRAVLEAAAVFLPSDATIVVTEHGMAEAVLSLAEPANSGAFLSTEALPQGWVAFAVSVSRLLGRAPRAGERPIVFLSPKVWAETERL